MREVVFERHRAELGRWGSLDLGADGPLVRSRRIEDFAFAGSCRPHDVASQLVLLEEDLGHLVLLPRTTDEAFGLDLESGEQLFPPLRLHGGRFEPWLDWAPLPSGGVVCLTGTVLLALGPDLLPRWVARDDFEAWALDTADDTTVTLRRTLGVNPYRWEERTVDAGAGPVGCPGIVQHWPCVGPTAHLVAGCAAHACEPTA